MLFGLIIKKKNKQNPKEWNRKDHSPTNILQIRYNSFLNEIANRFNKFMGQSNISF